MCHQMALLYIWLLICCVTHASDNHKCRMYLTDCLNGYCILNPAVALKLLCMSHQRISFGVVVVSLSLAAILSSQRKNDQVKMFPNQLIIYVYIMIYSRTPTGCNTSVDSKTLQPLSRLSSCNLKGIKNSRFCELKR